MSLQNVQLGFVNTDEKEGPDTRQFPERGSAPKPKYVVFHPRDIPELYPEKIFDRKKYESSSRMS